MATRTVVEAVVITATISLIIAAILFYFLYRFIIARRVKRNEMDSSFRREATGAIPRMEFRQHGGALKGLIVDEEGLDVLYLRKLEGSHFSGCFSKVWYNPMVGEVKRMDSRGDKPSISEPIQELPLLQEPSGTYDFTMRKPVIVETNSLSRKQELVGLKPSSERELPQTNRISPPSPPPTPLHQLESPINRAPPPPPPPPPPSPPPPRHRNGNNIKSSPPPAPSKPKPAPPPPPIRARNPSSSNKPPMPQRGLPNKTSKTESVSMDGLKENGEAQTKLKPLHWDKVTTNAEHSMVWNEINDGSFRFDVELIEALFGYSTPSQKPSNEKNTKTSNLNSVPSPQIFILDPRKSQNTAIILKSLAISRREILEALLEGRGLNADALEKLTKICPTNDEITKILHFNGNPSKLADAESFLYHILKSVPSAFIRFNALHFRSTYDPEILHHKESLQTLELGCKELRTGGIFFKLLEAILKAGNRMNEGTARGNAQGFNLTALRKLSDVKSTDGKTSLLHFVVEQVICSEGKRRLINQNSRREKDVKNEEIDREHLMIGLPVVARLSSDFANVKKAANIDHDNFNILCSNLENRINEIKQLLTHCKDESGGFVQEMKGFLEDCEDEMIIIRQEEVRVMDLVRKTTVYYQTGANKERGVNPLQLFTIVKDFLNMVDQVCFEIKKKVERTRGTSTASCSSHSPPLSPTPRSPMRFQNLESYFMAQKRHGMSLSDSEDEFS